MNSYEFSMEKVLKWREDIEKSNMEELAIIQNELNQHKNKLNNLIEEKKKAMAKGSIFKNINELKHQHLYLQTVEEKIQKQDELIEETNTKLEDARLKLVESQKNRKIMEKLKEKDMKEYRISLNLAEQNELDEIAVLKHQSQEFL